KRCAEDLRRLLRFAQTDRGGAARAHLAARQLDDSDGAAAAHEIDDGAAGCELDVIGVRPEKNRINGLRHHRLTILNVAASGSASLTIRSTSCSRYSHHHGSHATTRSCTC